MASKPIKCFDNRERQSKSFLGAGNWFRFLMVLVCCGWFLVGCSQQEDRAKELLRRRNAKDMQSRANDSTVPVLEEMAKKLTNQVIAENEEGSGAWIISEPDSSSYVKVPFSPVAARESPSSMKGGVSVSSGGTESHLTSLAELKQTLSRSNRNPGFLGADACRECHQERHSSFTHTAHHLTSGWMPSPRENQSSDSPLARSSTNSNRSDSQHDGTLVRGAYARQSSLSSLPLEGFPRDRSDVGSTDQSVPSRKEAERVLAVHRSVLQSEDPNLAFQMLRDDAGYYQSVKIADYQLKLPVHVFTGSAKAGQTFLYWHEKKLYQSFVSYLTELDQWIPSPGYYDTTADYTREIGTTCLECHVTYIESGFDRDTLKPDSAVWGISCERCHGPGKEHVEYHRSFPEVRVAKHIAQPADLPRQRQLDICSQCHSGSESLITGKFQFRPGMEVKKSTSRRGASEVGGVHTSNQLNRLAMSRCFQNSEMTCTTCHDPHVNQRGQRQVFSQSCLQCHQSNHCGMADQVGESISQNCIDCHMPTGANDQMTIEVGGGDRFTVRMIDHHIRVEKTATADFLRLNASEAVSEPSGNDDGNND